MTTADKEIRSSYLVYIQRMIWYKENRIKALEEYESTYLGALDVRLTLIEPYFIPKMIVFTILLRLLSFDKRKQFLFYSSIFLTLLSTVNDFIFNQ